MSVFDFFATREPQEKFRAAFGTLELIEQGYLKESQLDDERMGTNAVTRQDTS